MLFTLEQQIILTSLKIKRIKRQNQARLQEPSHNNLTTCKLHFVREMCNTNIQQSALTASPDLFPSRSKPNSTTVNKIPYVGLLLC